MLAPIRTKLLAHWWILAIVSLAAGLSGLAGWTAAAIVVAVGSLLAFPVRVSSRSLVPTDQRRRVLCAAIGLLAGTLAVAIVVPGPPAVPVALALSMPALAASYALATNANRYWASCSKAA